MFVKHEEFGYGEILPSTEIVEEETVVSVDVMFEHGIERNVSTYDLSELDEEELQELSKQTLGSYVKKASNDALNRAAGAAALQVISQSSDPKRSKEEKDAANELTNKAMKRKAGIDKAVDKMTEMFDEIATEFDLTEEELQELSTNTLKSYAGKAIKNREMHIGARDYNNKKAYDHEEKEYESGMSGDRHAQKMHSRKVDYHLYAQDSHQKEIEKRDKGLKTVAKKLGEESEYSAAERIAREILESRKDPRAEALRKDFESRK